MVIILKNKEILTVAILEYCKKIILGEFSKKKKLPGNRQKDDLTVHHLFHWDSSNKMCLIKHSVLRLPYKMATTPGGSVII